MPRTPPKNTPRADSLGPLGVFLVAALFAPLAIQLHELGHLLGYWIYGLDSLSLHYGYSGFAGQPEFWRHLAAGDTATASLIADIDGAGYSALLGPLVSYLLIAGSLWGLLRQGSLAFAALALATAARFPLVELLYLLGRSEPTDEAHIALVFGLPEGLFVGLGLAALLAATFGSGLLLIRQGQRRHLAAGLVGVLVGTSLWMGWLGPLLLP